MYRLGTDDETNRPRNPRTDANVFEILTFSWMLDLFRTGREKDLEEDDLYGTLDGHKSSTLGDELEKAWRSEVATARKERRRPSFLRTLIRTYGPKYSLHGLSHFVNEIILKISQPLFIGGLLAHFNRDGSDETDIRYAYMYAFGLVFGTTISMFFYHLTEIENQQCGMKIRVSCSSLIYRKALRLSHAAAGETTVGQVINLLSNDVNRFDTALTFLHYLWIGPLQTVIVAYFMWREIGVSSLLGIATLLFFIPIQVWSGKKLSEIRSDATAATDERLRLINEILSGIQTIKMYTWEKSFAELVGRVRKKEIGLIERISYIKSLIITFILIQPKIQLFFSILAYVLFGNDVSAQKVFVVSSFYCLLKVSMSMFFCLALEQTAGLMVAIRRIQNFLVREEKAGNGPTKWNDVAAANGELRSAAGNGVETQTGGLGVVTVADATAKWTDDGAVNTLENVNLTARPNRLVAIIGPVGAGKSSLMQAMLGELPLSAGRCWVRGAVSYASQVPWLFSGSIRQNILFGSPMDAARYEQVVSVCALKNDFKRLPYGDRTTVGERGVTLSGGQKARINLARTVYKQADVYLLDDPLSAVDTRVGKHLFDKCVRGYLKDKTCILVTHQIQYLTDVDQIVLMKNGAILAEGSYRELQASGIDFTTLLGCPETTDAAASGTGRDDPCPRGSGESVSSLVDAYGTLDGGTAEPDNEEAEHRSVGRVAGGVYASYLSASGSACRTFVCLSMFVVTQTLVTGSDCWIGYWVDDQTDDVRGRRNVTDVSSSSSDGRWTTRTYATVYAGLIVSIVVTIAVRSVAFVSAITAASRTLHETMLDAVIGATMRFLNTNSSGRIFNRFSKDMGAVDDVLPFILFECLQMLMSITGIVCAVGLTNVYLAVPVLLVGTVFYKFRDFYMPASRSVKRLESVARSPVYAHLGASMQGLTTIRAYGAQRIVSEEFDKYQDLHSAAWYLFICSNEALGLWLDLVCMVYITIVVYGALLVDGDTRGGNVGLVITQTIGLAGLVQWGIRQSTVLENQMTSVERVLEYTNCPRETVVGSAPDETPPDGWPRRGKIVFENASLRYGPGAPLVLNRLDVTIGPAEKVGIVGRTGAGKSSIVAALFRLAINEGRIFVDGVDIHGLGLRDLRSRISIIPQEPVLFSGTIRSNLDPLNEYPDHVLWTALDEVRLRTAVETLPGGLYAKMAENGSNFSIGQRQLVCLARAVARNNRIVVLDEATANVDPLTDALIQSTIRRTFRACTVLTIAHRLNTVMDSDRILVMDAGEAAEFDHPHRLLTATAGRGFLRQMVERTGHVTADLLRAVAAESFNAGRAANESPIRFVDDD